MEAPRVELAPVAVCAAAASAAGAALDEAPNMLLAAGAGAADVVVVEVGAEAVAEAAGAPAAEVGLPPKRLDVVVELAGSEGAGFPANIEVAGFGVVSEVVLVLAGLLKFGKRDCVAGAAGVVLVPPNRAFAGLVEGVSAVLAAC